MPGLLGSQAITDDDVDRIAMCIRVLAEQSPKMFDIFTKLCRQSLSVMLTAKAQEDNDFNKVQRHRPGLQYLRLRMYHIQSCLYGMLKYI